MNIMTKNMDETKRNISEYNYDLIFNLIGLSLFSI